MKEGREQLADEDRYADEFLLAHERLSAAGFEHYEVSNFCKPGRRSRHNAAYWTAGPYAALGPGAHAFFPPLRRWNLRSWTAYREAILAGHLPLEGEEQIDAEDAALERAWLGLRTDLGLPLAELSSVHTNFRSSGAGRGGRCAPRVCSASLPPAGCCSIGSRWILRLQEARLRHRPDFFPYRTRTA